MWLDVAGLSHSLQKGNIGFSEVQINTVLLV